MDKRIIIILFLVIFIGSYNASLLAQESNTTQKAQDEQVLDDSDEQEAKDESQESGKKKDKKKKRDVPEVRKKPDQLWVKQVYEDKYSVKFMNTRINCHDRLELRPDSTFRLSYTQANASAWCEGKWRQISSDSIVLNCIKNEPKQKQGNIFVEKGIRGVEVKGDKVRFPRDVTATLGKKKYLTLKKSK